jgi:6-phosphogluconolactonase
MKQKQEFTEIFPDAGALAGAAARRFVGLAKDVVTRRGVFAVTLAGGSTPKGLYTLLATDPALRGAVPWSQIHFFFGDERHVPLDHAESNFRMANEAMFQRLEDQSLHIHRVPAEIPDAMEVASRYEADLRGFFGETNFPRFDLVLLGMGADGHTASLFPGTAALQEEKRWVAANWVEKLQAHRITMTIPVLNNAAEIFFLVTGADKAAVIAEVLESKAGEHKYPVQMIRPRDGIRRWMLDERAASCL